MKVTTVSEEGFSPITFKVICENPQDLYNLWHRLNLHWTDVNAISCKYSDYPASTDNCTEFFKQVNTTLTALRLNAINMEEKNAGLEV